jgi:hypothetical protein
MSDPKRFDFWMYQKPCEEFGIRARMELEFNEYGKCVSWDDYAKLQAENERLRKAGDAMAYELHSCEPDRQIALIEDWFVTKEGRDAK